MLTEQEARARAERGASRLSHYDPSWMEGIDLDTLDIGDSTTCIIGQSQGAYISILDELGLWSAIDVIENGFDVVDPEDAPVQQAAWVALIRERRGEA